MKLILSRKGFDSEYGRVPSPIFEDGTLVSLPIPSASGRGRPLGDIASQVGPLAEVVSGLTRRKRIKIDASTMIHLDPDLNRSSVRHRLEGWRPAFGQGSAAQSHLANQGVGIGDVFLFFGWFRRAERAGDGWRYLKDAPDIHCMFGWLQVGEVINVAELQPIHYPKGLQEHPHFAFAKLMAHNNTIYVCADSLFDGEAPGAGVFTHWSSHLQLTADGRSRSRWRLPAWMHPSSGLGPMSYHPSQSRWLLEDGHAYLESVAKGQEFVLDVGTSRKARNWVRKLIRHGVKA